MKTPLCLTVCVLAVLEGFAAPLQNLNFEEYDPVTWLVPGWTFEMPANPFGGSQVLTHLPLDYGVNDPVSPNPPYATIFSKEHKPFGFPADTGNYLVGLVSVITRQLYPWYLRQTGEIPADAKSMWFDIGGAQVSLKLNGVEVALDYYVRSGAFLAGWDFADVAAFAGQTVTMELTAPGSLKDVLPFLLPETGYPYTLLDNITFSASPIPTIPEPRTLTLIFIGALLAFLHWRLLRSSR